MQIERGALFRDEALVILALVVASMRREDAEEDQKRLQLRRADVPVVDELRFARTLGRHECVRHAFESGCLVDGNIKRVQEQAVRGGEGACALRRGGEERVQRIDADEVGAGLRRDLGEARQVLKVADAPVARGF